MTALATPAAEYWTAPLQSTALLALIISCIHPSKVGTDEGMRLLSEKPVAVAY